VKAGRILGWVAALAVVAGGAAWALRDGSARPDAGLSFETAVVDRGSVVAKVTASGTLSALVTVQVGSQVSGRIQSLAVDFNSKVQKGDVIATLDSEFLDAALAQATANHVAARGELVAAQVKAKDADRQLGRNRELAARKLIATADLETSEANAASARAAVAVARGRLAQAEAALGQAETNLGYATIVAPISGVVISRSVDVGQTVAASLQAPTLFAIAEDLARMQVDTSVAEADIGRLSDGMAASFSVDAWPGERFEGTVRQIRFAPQTVQNVVTYNAVIDVANPELKLRPGMTANVTFVVSDRQEVLRVPNGALRFRPEADVLTRLQAGPAAGHGQVAASAPAPLPKGTRAVWVQRGEGRAERVDVRVGVTDGTRTEVLEGLVEGDVVVLDASATGGLAASKSGGRRMGPPGPF
jgi:HlyD family secretion protein